jgi:hypothetical protein
VFSSQPTLRRLAGAALTVLVASAVPCAAQVTPAAGYTPPDDTPAIKVGVTIFADYTINQKPKVKDADGNDVTLSQFQVGRSYINVTGNISHSISFRITPDIQRETGVGSSLNGSYTFRLKYAFAQFNLDDYMTKGSWIRLGLQQTPYIDFAEGVYRYRFQGPVFEDREGFLTSSDNAASFHYNLAQNYGDIHVGIYNGEGYGKPEANDKKAVQIRGTIRPLAHGAPNARGLRLTGFYDADQYVKSGEKRRAVFSLTYEHKYLNGAFDYLDAKDQTSATKASVSARGWSVWVTPRSTTGWEGLLRYDQLEPDRDASGKRKRTIAGVAYWFPHQGGVSSALLFDVDNTTFDGFTPAIATQRKIGVHALVNF